MGFADEYWRDTQDLAEACADHPFVRGLGDGSLSRERYVRFIAQDAFFLDVFARGFAAGVLRAPDQAGRRVFHDLQAGVFQELRLHATASRDLGIDLASVEPMEAARGYTEFLLANAIAGSLGELVSSMTPCMALYGYLGKRLAAEQTVRHSYSDWIETYAGDDFGGLVESLNGLLDTYCGGAQAERERYRRAMQWEWRFFDEAWRGEA